MFSYCVFNINTVASNFLLYMNEWMKFYVSWGTNLGETTSCFSSLEMNTRSKSSSSKKPDEEEQGAEIVTKRASYAEKTKCPKCNKTKSAGCSCENSNTKNPTGKSKATSMGTTKSTEKKWDDKELSENARFWYKYNKSHKYSEKHCVVFRWRCREQLTEKQILFSSSFIQIEFLCIYAELCCVATF